MSESQISLCNVVLREKKKSLSVILEMLKKTLHGSFKPLLKKTVKIFTPIFTIFSLNVLFSALKTKQKTAQYIFSKYSKRCSCFICKGQTYISGQVQIME